MKTFIQSGNIVPVIAPAGGAVSGRGVLIGAALFGIANTTVPAGDDVEINLVGVFDHAKAAGALAAGAKVYWDDTNKVMTATASGNTLVATAIAAALSGDATVRARLNGFVG